MVLLPKTRIGLEESGSWSSTFIQESLIFFPFMGLRLIDGCIIGRLYLCVNNYFNVLVLFFVKKTAAFRVFSWLACCRQFVRLPIFSLL